ncbi:MAG: tetratricopeptide repeat protein [Bacteroidia bacterium]
MIARYIPVFTLWLCWFSPVWSQSETAGLAAGISAYQQGNYESAIRMLARIIESEGPESKSKIPEAHFYISQAYYQVSLDPALAAVYPDALLRAYNHLMASRDTDVPGAGYQRIADAALEVLWPAIYNTAVEAYNLKNYDRAVVFFAKARQINPRFFAAALNQGYSHWQVGDTLAAIKSWQKSLELYQIVKSSESREVMQSTLLMLANAYSQRRMPAESTVFFGGRCAVVSRSLCFPRGRNHTLSYSHRFPPRP